MRFLKALTVLVVLSSGSPVAAEPITIGYQLIYNPWKVAIDDGSFERATGREIRWRRFDSGAKVLTGMASGDVHARGGPEAPMDRDEVIAKFMEFATPPLGVSRAAAIRDAVLGLQSPDAKFSDLGALIYDAADNR